MKKIWLVVLLGFCTACGIVTSEEDPHVELVDVIAQKVNVTSATPTEITFDFEGTIPTPCYDFEGAEISNDGLTYFVKVKARANAEVCITVVGTLEVNPLNVSVATSGTYTFRFWKSDTETLDVQVDVP